jgi:hypothetical protein
MEIRDEYCDSKPIHILEDEPVALMIYLVANTPQTTGIPISWENAVDSLTNFAKY